MAEGNGRQFCREIKKMDPKIRKVAPKIGEVAGDENIVILFKMKYCKLYNFVPTESETMQLLRNEVDNGITKEG